MSGLASSSHPSRLASRPFMPLMLYVAIRIEIVQLRRRCARRAGASDAACLADERNRPLPRGRGPTVIGTRRAGLETVPVLADRTLPAPYPPYKMICPAAQRSAGVKFAMDSLLEGDGFELPVP